MVFRNVWEDISRKVLEKRKFETRDLVRRLVVLSANNIRVRNYPLQTPKAIFNPSIRYYDGKLRIYARVILGYYLYASAVAEFDIILEELNGNTRKIYEADITVIPDNPYDLWGVEDPRVYEINGKLLMTYCGRTLNYFDSQTERTLPITAKYEGGKWVKIAVFVMPDEIRSFVVSDKNAFLVKAQNVMLFHRLHMLNGKFYLAVCKVPEWVLNLHTLKEIEIGENIAVMEPAPFESKIGWGTPPIKVDEEYLTFLHGVDKYMSVYRVFAVLLNSEGIITAITPFYILEPKEIYERFGDRPFVVFPCGAVKLGNKILISYGGADTNIVIGEIDFDILMNILYENRV